VVSKYIGETEKNLAEVFAQAEGFRALLFFDEADALFDKRTGTRDAHDRYANLEVNFLLQRLEAFDGIAVLATNMPQQMDEAFTRRFTLSIHFPRPTPGRQLALWRHHLPAGRLAPGLDLERLVTRHDLVGGEIRNAALTAAYAAAAAGGTITQALLEAAAAQELEKQGRPIPTG
jgi:SpoVK/Ycf46/Vps4 family AAA+-type ATPase